jgi:hypothetical protein
VFKGILIKPITSRNATIAELSPQDQFVEEVISARQFCPPLLLKFSLPKKSVSLSLSLVVVVVAVAVTCRRDSNYSNGSSSDFSVGATDLPFVYRHYKPLHAPTSQTHSNSLQASKSKPQSRIPTTTTSPSTS